MAQKRESTVVRRKVILEMLSEKGEVSVSELSDKFEVSEVTIRNDLDQLEQKKVLIRARGGALKLEANVANDQRLGEKSKINLKEKIKIGKKAAQLVLESDTVIIDSGSTTGELAKNLPDLNDLTVITNALNIANLLGAAPQINLIIPGGYLRKNSLSLVGPLAEKSLLNFNVDKVFLGVDGFDTRQGIYTPNIEEARLNEIMIEISQEVIVLTDSSKFSKRSFAFICNPSRIHKVITDNNILLDDKKRLQDSGVEVIIV
ncbi:MAG: DeoR/GlpR transcriptional regulator [Saprospiraceae bacterium]|nr:DeoR/GlpR transcriptional regulator [Saprospiraceae bacterium]